MTDDRRRAWECAVTLLENHRDLLVPRTYAMCWAAAKNPPEKLCVRRARRIKALFGKLAGKEGALLG